MMANPMEYREAMWAILHGEEPPKSTDKAGSSKAPVRRSAPTAADWAELDAFNKQIAEIKSQNPPTDGA